MMMEFLKTLSKAKFNLISLLLLLLLWVGQGYAFQTTDADVDFYVVLREEAKPFTVGDRITLRLEVKHPAGTKVELPQLEEEWGNFEVIEQTTPETTRSSDGTAITGKNIVISLFEPGQYETPRLLVTHQKEDGSVEELAAPIIPLEIQSVLVEGDTELRDLKPQAILPVPPLWPWLLAAFMALSLVLGAVVGTGLWLYHRRRKREMLLDLPPGPVIDPRPPEVIAYAELDRIAALDLPAQNQIKEHYSLVTDCLRHYIEGRYQIPALEQTTSELKTSFSIALIASEIVRKFLNIFQEGDLVKFARYRPQPQDAYSLLDRARNLIRTTTPTPAPEDTKEPQEVAP
jgi:hypothetical protein